MEMVVGDGGEDREREGDGDTQLMNGDRKIEKQEEMYRRMNSALIYSKYFRFVTHGDRI